MTNREKLNELIAKANKELGTNYYSEKNYNLLEKSPRDAMWLDLDMDLGEKQSFTNPHSKYTEELEPFTYSLVVSLYKIGATATTEKEVELYDFLKGMVYMHDKNAYYNFID